MKKMIISPLLVVMLGACNGGGGGDSGTQSDKSTSNDAGSNVGLQTTNSLPGLYIGTVTSSMSSMEYQSAAILGEDGSIYFTSPDQCPTFSGKYQSKAGVLTGEGAQAKTYAPCAGFKSSSISNAMLQGAESSAGVSGTITYEFNSGADSNVTKTTKTFSMKRSSQASTPKLLADMAGNYAGLGNRLHLNIDANGVITGTFDDNYPFALSIASKTANCNGLLTVSKTYNLGALDLACYNTGNGNQSLSMKGKATFSKNQAEKKEIYAMFDYWIYDTAYVVGETKRVGSASFLEQ